MSIEFEASGPDGRTSSSEGTTTRGQRAVQAVTLAVVVILVLVAWVVMVPYRGDAGGSRPLDCDVMVNWPMDAEGRRALDRFYESCDEAESTRRTIALVAGAIAATVACAVSTWPSRRLTGEELGPLR